MKTIKFIFVMLIVATLSACAANKLSTGGNVKVPFNQAVRPHSKVLVISTVNNKFYLQQDLSVDSYNLPGGDLDPVILQASGKALADAGYKVETAKWSIDEPIVNLLPVSETAATVELAPSVLRQLEAFDANYHADYIMLITGASGLRCSSASGYPVNLIMHIYVIDTHNSKILFWYSNKLAEDPDRYSSSNNRKLCKEISASPLTTPRKQALGQWLNAKASQFTRQNILELFNF